MKVESASGKVHSVKETYDSKYFNNLVKTKCGKEMAMSSFVPEDGICRKTSAPITCKRCKKSKA